MQTQPRPNLFIAGAARSGTTSLWQYLKAHPQVYMPADEMDKEPGFFAGLGRRRTLADYLELFKPAGNSCSWLGEASTAYLTNPSSAQAIHDFNPEARILIMLRNPAERALSLYQWMAQDGYEYAADFAEALRLEPERAGVCKPDWFQPLYFHNYLYYHSGLYAGQVQRYVELFKDQVLMLRFEDMICDPQQTYEKVCDFLAIAPVQTDFRVHNPSRAVRSARLQFALRKLNTWIIRKNQDGLALSEIVKGAPQEFSTILAKLSKRVRLTPLERLGSRWMLLRVLSHLHGRGEQGYYRTITTKTQRDELMVYGLKKGRPVGLDGPMRNHLLEGYRGDVRQLEMLTGMDFSDWFKQKVVQ